MFRFWIIFPLFVLCVAGCATPPPQILARQQSSSPPPPGMCEDPRGENWYEPGRGGQAHAGTQNLQGQQGGQDTGGEGDFAGSTGSSEMPTREQVTGATGAGREYIFQRNEGSIEPGARRWIGPLLPKLVSLSERPTDRTEGCEDDEKVFTRQLCEAAMKEEDPFLRSALWDEYNGYKKILARQ